MKVKKLLAMILVASTTLVATACGNTNSSSGSTVKETSAKESVKDGGNLVFSIRGEPEILNPIYAYDRDTMTMDNALFAPLFYMNGDKIDYTLAEEVKHSNDFLTYTVKLKKDLKWHDDKPLTANDLVFTMKQIMDEKQDSPFRSAFVINDKPVEVKKVDDLTVEFKLPTVQMPFMNSLGQVSPIPKHVFEGEKDIKKSVKNEKPIGSGAFKFKESKKGESITLERFDNYVGGKPHLDTITYRIVADQNSSGVALENGEISANYIDISGISKFEKNEKLKIVAYDEGMVDNLVLNCKTKGLDKKEVRQAIAYALNKDNLIKAAYESEKYAPKAYSPLAKNALYYTEDVTKYDLNKDKAKELLKKSGAENLKLKLVYRNDKKALENQALVVKENLKDIGIDVELKGLEANAFFQQFDSPDKADFDLIFNGYVMGSEPDAYKEVFMTGGAFNASRYNNKKLDDLWNKAAIETDKTKREEIYKTIQKELMEDMPLYPICYSNATIAVNKNVGGIKEAKTAPIYMFQDLSKLYMIEK
ncbi:peptide ABC transporter substrate-binding protein [Clostridium botulinum A2B7 92]|uniref:ABC transporter substrate-binding protein n=1 Tax=Clostridium botulinum TaxID=1491 RepID=UPI0007E0160E|nr:ABC transporter substrate-binding protein [Clostridium botulinum]KEJ00618.1 peptide ABC transporter substrate-binding protein [Clostridium botulinum A2B7 92]